ncbi:hypothetical protein T484DRAFT_1843789, partial [Baffinella frigidus]
MHPTIAAVVAGNVASTCLSALSGVKLADCTPGKLMETGGMRGFLGSAPGFSGRIKEQNEDFRVNEVSLLGELVTVSDTDVEDTSLEFYVPEPSVAPAPPAGESDPPPKVPRAGSSDNKTTTDSRSGGAVGEGGADGEAAGGTAHCPAARDPELERLIRN